MPVVRIQTPASPLTLKYDFEFIPVWTVSVRSLSGPVKITPGLFDFNLELRAKKNTGLQPAWIYGPYRDDPARFSCGLEDEWGIA